MLNTIIWLLPLLPALWAIGTFNRLVRRLNLVREAWSGVDVQLLRRHDLVPRLAAVVRGQGDYERKVLAGVTELRSAGQQRTATPELRERENALTDRLRSVLALVEGYPELRASQSYLDLQRQLVEVEDQLQHARRYYNGAVRDYNTLRELFPANIVAFTFRFRPEIYFDVASATVREVPEVRV
jgi:LemA protein